jgi:hypothetical protein
MAQPNPTQSNPWLQLAMEALQLIFKEPPFIRASIAPTPGAQNIEKIR